MDLAKLAVVFLTVIVLLRWKRPLYQAILGGIAATVLLYQIPPLQVLRLCWTGSTNWDTLSVVLILYQITFLQRMLEKRDQLRLAQQDLNGIFNNRRVNASWAPIFIGLLPSAAAAKICAEIVDDSCGDYLDRDEKAFVTSYFRHIPESFLPTYTGVILLSQLSGVGIPEFVVGMLPLILAMYLIGYFFYLRRIPRETGAPPSAHKLRDAARLFQHLWSLIAIIVLILALDLPVYAAVGIVILLCVPVYRLRWAELRPMFKSAFEARLIVNSYLVMVLKEFISHTGAITTLPETFARLPIPPFLIFACIFFIGSIISGSNAIIAICTTVAFTAIPGGGMPLMVLLMSFAYAAMQISPTHVCLVVVAECFDTSLGALIKKTIPPIAVFCAVALGYYLLLAAVF